MHVPESHGILWRRTCQAQKNGHRGRTVAPASSSMPGHPGLVGGAHLLIVYATCPLGFPWVHVKHLQRAFPHMLQWSRSLCAHRPLYETNKRGCCDFCRVGKATITTKSNQALKSEPLPARQCLFLEWNIGLPNHMNSVLQVFSTLSPVAQCF